MEEKSNIFIKALSIITYKKKNKPGDFYIPEINETGANTGTADEEKAAVAGRVENVTADGQNSGSSKEGDEEKEGKESREGKGLKKPIPVAVQEKKEENGTERKEEKGTEKPAKKADDETVSTSLRENMAYLRKKFNFPDNKDIVIREFMIAKKYKAFIAYLDGMVDKITINNFILRPLLTYGDYNEAGSCKLDFILESVIETNQTKRVYNHDEAVYEILMGDTLVYVDGCSFYLTNETKGYDKRGVEKPVTEAVVVGGHEAFNETLRTNVTLIRKNIKNSSLTTEFKKIGDVNQTLCAVIYLKGLTNPAIVDEVKRRIEGVKTDIVFGDGMLEQFIEDSPYSLIPTILTTERPDRAASHLLEGRVAILVDGSPFAKIVPITLPSMMHSPEDSYLRWQYGSFIRLIRLLSAFIAIMLPGMYIAITDFHQEMIPTDLLIAIAKAKENVPFPTLLEVLLMEISFELIREAGIRIPGIIGNTLGIIGALILGQAAVSANIVSPILIIVVAITGLGNFAIPNYGLAFAARLLRFIFIISGALLGFYGITITLIIMTVAFMNTKSFGIPFYSSISPKVRRGWDAIFRWPLWMQEFRPDPVNPLIIRRQPEISRQWAKEEPHFSYRRKEDGTRDD